jgi:hypothetical protein
MTNNFMICGIKSLFKENRSWDETGKKRAENLGGGGWDPSKTGHFEDWHEYGRILLKLMFIK